MKKFLAISLSVLTLGSCSKDFDELNVRTKDASTVPAETLFTNGVRNLVDGITSPNVNTNVFRFTVQHWAATTYQDEPNYDFTTRAIPQSWWTRMYRDVLNDLEESTRLISENATLDDKVKANKLATIDVMRIYTYTVLVNSFGDVPYTEALKVNDNLFPKYDDAKTIYDDLFTKLAADIAALDATAEGITAKQDLLYKGDVAAWKKFASALQLRMAMTIADEDASKAKAAFEAADAGAFASAGDNAKFAYLPVTPNTNPIWVDLVQSNRQDMVAGKPLLDKLTDMSDPRLTLYFRPNNDGAYVGGVVGSNNTFANVSKPGQQVIDPASPSLLIDYSEVEFLRAEAIERGFNVSGTAAEHYNKAVKASIEYWGGTSAEADAYISRPDVDYATATGDWKQKIGFQKWIGLYNSPVQGWTEIRRLDQPVLAPPAGAKSGFPTRFTYPANEQQLNPSNYTSASTAIGGDEVETKLFWDKF